MNLYCFLVFMQLACTSSGGEADSTADLQRMRPQREEDPHRLKGHTQGGPEDG